MPRSCEVKVETIDHLVSSCSILSPKGIGETQRYWYQHHSASATEGKATAVLWYFPVLTSRTIQVNRLDIIIKDKANNRHECILDRNLSAKMFQLKKLSKYKDLEIEEKMWHLKTKTLPVVIGALGLIKKDTDMINGQIPGNSRLKEI